MSRTNHSWQDFREQFPATSSWTYLDNAAVAPLSKPAQEAISRWSAEATEQGTSLWPQWARRVESARTRAAELVGAETEEIAFVPNTTAGIGLVAEGFPWQAGDNVVVLSNEFPSNIYPWLNLANRGVETRRVPISEGDLDLDRIAAACDERTRILSISWVGYSTGWRIDVGEVVRMAHDLNVLVFLDAIQGLGVFPLDVRQTDLDFFAADGHKWLVGPEGAGLFFVRRDHLDRLRPLGVGWNSVVHSHDFARIELTLKETAARYEGGSQNMVGVLALGASMDLLSEYGLTKAESPIAERILDLTRQAAIKLEQAGAQVVRSTETQHQSGILSFDLPGTNHEAVKARCREAQVLLSCRGSHLRISPHAYANEDDLEQLMHALSTAAKIK